MRRPEPCSSYAISRGALRVARTLVGPRSRLGRPACGRLLFRRRGNLISGDYISKRVFSRMMQYPQQTTQIAPPHPADLETLARRQSSQAEGSVASARTAGAVPTPATSQRVDLPFVCSHFYKGVLPCVRSQTWTSRTTPMCGHFSRRSCNRAEDYRVSERHVTDGLLCGDRSRAVCV